jgi:DNA-directed RNA polymerase, mitochondrial
MTTNQNINFIEDQREGEMIRLGKERFDTSLRKNIEKGRQGVTPAYIYLTKELLLPLSVKIDDFVNERNVNLGRPMKGRPKEVVEPLMELADNKKVSLIILKSVIESVSLGKTLVQAATDIGSMIEIEIQNQIFKKTLPNLHAKILKDLVNRTRNLQHKKKVFAHTLTKYQVPVEHWPIEKKVIIGKQLISLLIEATGVVFIEERTVANHKTRNYLRLDPEVEKKISSKNSQIGVLTPFYKAMVCVPNLWSSPFNGGFVNEYLAKQPLIKTNNYKYLHDIEKLDLKDWYESINYIQSVPFKIDQNMLNVFKTIWEENLPLADFPSRDSLINTEGKPKNVFRPSDVDTNKEALIKYKRNCRLVHEQEIVRVSKVLSARISLEMAIECSSFHRLWFALQVDTRGRIYYIGTGLNPQSDEKTKSLLCFGDAERIGSRGIYWLYVYASNCWGNDKVSFEDRYKFTLERKQEFISYAKDFIANTGWNNADKPLLFLQCCFHIANVEEQGEDYMCDLPVAMDATCSGLQILSMMIRDEGTAEKVNVTPSNLPKDIYSIIASRVEEDVKKLVDTCPEANRWLQFGIGRKIVKRNIMTYVYGLKPYGARQQIFDEYKSMIEKHPEKAVLADDGFSDCRWLSKIIWNNIEEEVKLATELMRWFQDCSKVFSKLNKPISWTTPLGFKVVQDYKYLVPFQVKTAINGSLVYTTLRRQIEKSDSRRNASASSPNITHSFDGSLVSVVALFAKYDTQPIKNLMVVHDSFATTPNRVDDLHKIIRNAVVHIFKDDLITKLYEEWKSQLDEQNQHELPLPPSLGNLDIDTVISSNYLFS